MVLMLLQELSILFLKDDFEGFTLRVRTTGMTALLQMIIKSVFNGVKTLMMELIFLFIMMLMSEKKLEVLKILNGLMVI